MEGDALAMAGQGGLRTVDADQTVFSQGFGPSAFSLYPAMLLYPSLSRFYFVLEHNFRGSWKQVLLCPARLGQDQGEQQSGQGPVSLRLLAPLTALVIATDPPIL